MEKTYSYIDYFGRVAENELRLVHDDGGNWYLCINDTGALYYIAKENSGCNSGYFGDMKHLLNLLLKYKNYKKENFTDYGIELLNDSIKNSFITLDSLFN